MPSRIALVGTDGTRADGAGAFEVRVCNFFGAPVSGAMVSIPGDWDPSIRLGPEAEPAPQPLLSCTNPFVRSATNANGVAAFILSGSIDLAQVGGFVAPTLRIYANGVLMGDIPVICYDLDGHGGVGAGDLSQWLTLFATGEPWPVADYSGDGALGAEDLSMWLGVFDSGAQIVSAAPLCP